MEKRIMHIISGMLLVVALLSMTGCGKSGHAESQRTDTGTDAGMQTYSVYYMNQKWTEFSVYDTKIDQLESTENVIDKLMNLLISTEDEQLYDRCILLHTTWIPYREFEEVLGIHGIDEYIRYGGTMSLGGVHYNETSTFATLESTDQYVYTAIARNIQHSLRCYQYENHFQHLRDLYDKNELTSAINRVVGDINHRFTLEVLTQDFKSHDLGTSASNLRRDRKNPTDILDRVDVAEVTDNLRKLLEIRNKKEQQVELDDVHAAEIEEYLNLLEFEQKNGFAFAIVFLICVSLILCYIVSYLVDIFVKQIKAVLLKEKMYKKFNNLQDVYKNTLIQIYRQPTKSLKMEMSNSVAAYLTAIRAIDRSELSDMGYIFDYFLQPWVVMSIERLIEENKKYIKKLEKAIPKIKDKDEQNELKENLKVCRANLEYLTTVDESNNFNEWE